MPFSNTTFAKASFKFALGIAHTSNNREFYDESDVSAFILAAQNIWAEDIDSVPSTAETNEVVSEELSLHVEQVPGYNSYYIKLSDTDPVPTSLAGKTNPLTKAVYAQGDRVGHIIPRLFGEDYLPELRDPIVAPSSPNNIVGYGDLSNWFLDPFAGIITQENALALSSQARVVCRVYTGEFISERFDRLQTELDNAVISGGSVTPTQLTDLENTLQTQIDLISAGLGNVAQGDVTFADLASISGALDTRINNAFLAIGNNTTLINSVSAQVLSNDSDIASLQLSLDNILVSGGAVTPSDISELQDQIDDINNVTIANIQSEIDTLSGALDVIQVAVSENQNNIGDNAIDIGNLQTSVGNVESSIASISATHNLDISNIRIDLQAISGDVVQNKLDIATNVDDIAELRIDLNAAAISAGAVLPSEITNLQSQINALSAQDIILAQQDTTLEGLIQTNSSSISAINLSISQVQNDISDNTIAVENNTTLIEGLSADIAQNSSDINENIIAVGNNTTLIKSITADVLQNTLDIDTLRDDLNNVSLSGGGGITTDQINAIYSSIAVVSAGVDINTSNIDSLTITVSSNEAALNGIGAQIATNQNDIADLFDQKADLTLVGSISGELQQQINDIINISGGGFTGFIGPAEDGDYTDGVFTDFLPTTPVGTAVDRFNQLLKIFSPPSPPPLNSFSSNTGESAKMSYDENSIPGANFTDPTDLNGETISISINEAFNVGGNRRGVFNGTTDIQGTLNDQTPAHEYSYDAGAFLDGDKGTLTLLLNNTAIKTIDLSVPSISGNQYNANGSGFNISAPKAITFENGQEVASTKYRTGTWKVDKDDYDKGYHIVKVVHDVNGDIRETQQFEFFVDDESSRPTLNTQSLHDLSMISIKYLSGVQYHTEGVVLYDLDIFDAYSNCYSKSNITFNAVRCQVFNEAFPDTGGVDDNIFFNSKLVTIGLSTRILAQNIGIEATVPKPLGRSESLGQISDFELLFDPFIENYSGTNETNESFNTERYRINASLEANQTNMRNITYTTTTSPTAIRWLSNQNLNSGPNHSNGLLQYNGRLYYPNNSSLPYSGNFSAIADGPSPGQANYSAANVVNNIRTYYRFFYFPGLPGKTNFSLGFTKTNTNFVSVATGPSGNNLTVEMMLPNGTTDQNGSDNTIGNVEFKDVTVPFSSGNEGAVGCGWDSNKNGRDFGIKFGTRNTSMSNGVVILKIKASSGWSGYIDSIVLVNV
jgi:hypothetical protein